MAFKDRFIFLRDSRHLSQDELARQLGVSKSAISMYENGNREPKDLETLEKIADFFNVDMNYLLDKMIAPPTTSTPKPPSWRRRYTTTLTCAF